MRFKIDVDDKQIARRIEKRINDGITDASKDISRGIERRAKSKIRNEGAVFRYHLLEGFANARVEFGNRTVVSVRNVSKHAESKEYGVSGTEKKRDTHLGYKDKKPPLIALIPWVRQNLVGFDIDLDDSGGGSSGSGGVQKDTSTAASDSTYPTPPDHTNDPTHITVDDWGDWEKADERFWYGQEVRWNDHGTERTGVIVDSDDSLFRVDTNDDGMMERTIKLNDPDTELLEYENWHALNPIRQKQTLKAEVLQRRGDDDVEGGSTPTELMDVFADWMANDFYDRFDDNETVRRLTSRLQWVDREDGASQNNTDYGGFGLNLDASDHVQGKNKNGYTKSNREYWIDNPTIWHEVHHALASITGYDTEAEGTIAAHAHNSAVFSDFKNWMIPLSYDRDGNFLDKWSDPTGSEDYSKWIHDAWYHMFSDLEEGYTPDATASDVLGFEDWKDDVSDDLLVDPIDWGNIDFDEDFDREALLTGQTKQEIGLSEGNLIHIERDLSDDGTDTVEAYVERIQLYDNVIGDHKDLLVVTRDKDDNKLQFSINADTGEPKSHSKSDIIGHTKRQGNELPEPSDWMPTNGDANTNLVEAANRAWWKQAMVITNDDTDRGENSHAVIIKSVYSATNAHETLAMGRQLLEEPSKTSLRDLEFFYRYHPALVKMLIHTGGLDPTIRSKLEKLAKKHDWDDLLAVL